MCTGSGNTTNFWFELLEWLLERGARKFLIALENCALESNISHEVKRIIVQKNATIVTTQMRTETVDDASELLKQANNIAPLQAVFFVSLVKILSSR